jgi:hypothetical protein
MLRTLTLLLAGIAASMAETAPEALASAEGAHVRVYADSRPPVNGKLHIELPALIVYTGRDRVQFGLPSVERVTRKSRARGALWGFIVGFGIAAPVGAYAGPYLADWGNPSATVRLRHAAGWGLFFGGAGAGIGALTGVQRTIYRRAASR